MIRVISGLWVVVSPWIFLSKRGSHVPETHRYQTGLAIKFSQILSSFRGAGHSLGVAQGPKMITQLLNTQRFAIGLILAGLYTGTSLSHLLNVSTHLTCNKPRVEYSRDRTQIGMAGAL